MFLSIIIPIYNEENILKKNIKEVCEFFFNKFIFEIIIVNDGSTDNSFEILDNLDIPNLNIINNDSNLGKGASIKKGILSSRGEIILITDADLSTPIQYFNDLYAKYKQGYNIVIGSRSTNDSKILIKQNLLRIFAGKIFNFLTCTILNLKFKDTQCGFKLFEQQKINTIMQMCIINRFAFDVEILFLAKKLGYRTYEKGVLWSNNKNSSVSILSDSLNMFFDVIKIRFTKY